MALALSHRRSRTRFEPAGNQLARVGLAWTTCSTRPLRRGACHCDALAATTVSLSESRRLELSEIPHTRRCCGQSRAASCARAHPSRQARSCKGVVDAGSRGLAWEAEIFDVRKVRCRDFYRQQTGCQASTTPWQLPAPCPRGMRRARNWRSRLATTPARSCGIFREFQRRDSEQRTRLVAASAPPMTRAASVASP